MDDTKGNEILWKGWFYSWDIYHRLREVLIYCCSEWVTKPLYCLGLFYYWMPESQFQNLVVATCRYDVNFLLLCYTLWVWWNAIWKVIVEEFESLLLFYSIFILIENLTADLSCYCDIFELHAVLQIYKNHKLLINIENAMQTSIFF